MWCVIDPKQCGVTGLMAAFQNAVDGGSNFETAKRGETLEEAQRRIMAEVALDGVHQNSNHKWNDEGASMRMDASGMTLEPNLWRENAGLVAISIVVAIFDLCTVWMIYDEIDANQNDKVGLI